MGLRTKMKGLACVSACLAVAVLLSPTIVIVVVVPPAAVGGVCSVRNVSKVLALVLAAILLIPTILPLCIHRAKVWLLPFTVAIICGIGVVLMFVHNALWADSWGFTFIGPILLACYASSISMESLAIKRTDQR